MIITLPEYQASVMEHASDSDEFDVLSITATMMINGILTQLTILDQCMLILNDTIIGQIDVGNRLIEVTRYRTEREPNWYLPITIDIKMEQEESFL